MELGELILVFISIIVGIALVTALGPMVWENTNTYDIVDESVNVSTDRSTTDGQNFSGTTTFSIFHDNIITLILVKFDNGTVLTEDTDFTFDEDLGTFLMLNTSTTEGHVDSNMTNWTYSVGDNYVKDATSRTILSTFIILFFVIGIVAIGLGWVWKRYNEF